MGARSMLSALTSSRVFLQQFASLLEHRDPESMASDALSILISDFGATAASLYYATRPSIYRRQGALSDAIIAHIEWWEASVEQRIIFGPWNVGSKDEILASRPVPGTDKTVVYSLIRDDETVAGSICAIFPERKTPTGEQRRLLATFMEAVGNAICLVGEQVFVKERLTQLTLFYQMAQSMVSTFDLQRVFEDTMQLATSVLDASASALMLVDEENQELIFEYAYGDMGSALRMQRTLLDEGIAGWVATNGAPVIANNARQDPRFSDKVDTRTGFLTKSVVCVPIQMRGKTIGVLEALNKRGDTGFDSEDLNLMITTANQAAIAIDNARLYQSLREERDRIIQSEETVRRQVARNLHDGTVQFLSAIAMGLDHLERLLEIKPEAAKSEVGALRALTRQATQQARLALFELRPLILEAQGLVPALIAYVEQLRGSEEFNVHLEAPNEIPDLDRSIAVTVFAIVQEAVSNTKKHAAARDVWLRLTHDGQWLQVVIEDNGKGFDTERMDREYDQRGSIGLLTMRERAELLEGHLQLQASTGPSNSGTKVTLRVPMIKDLGQNRS